MGDSEDSANMSTNSGNSSANNRPANNLQQLLSLSTSLQSESDSSTVNQTEEEEKRIFLQSALSSMTYDIGTHLQEFIELMKNIDIDPNFSVEKYSDILENIVDFVGSIDHANEFYQKGGFEVILPLLQHNNPALRWRAASVIAECCQNNLFCQSVSTSVESLFLLIELITRDTDLTVQQKAVSALSAIVRDNRYGVEKLQNMQLLHEILDVGLSSKDDRLFNKTVWLVSALAHTSHSIKDDLVRLGAIEKMIRRLHSNKTITAEHVIQALISLTRNHRVAAKECLRDDLALLKYLQMMVLENKSDESFKDFIHCAEELMQILLSSGVLTGYSSQCNENNSGPISG